jgi:excisionase family DNA binding protein
LVAGVRNQKSIKPTSKALRPIATTHNLKENTVAFGIATPVQTSDPRPMKRNPNLLQPTIAAWATADGVNSGSPSRPMISVDGPHFLTVSGAASLLRVSQNTVHRQIACGGLSVYRLGSSVCISITAVWLWLIFVFRTLNSCVRLFIQMQPAFNSATAGLLSKKLPAT